MSTEQVEGLAKDLTSDDKALRIVAAQHIGKFVLEPAKPLIKYITEGNCIESLAVSFSVLELPDYYKYTNKTIANDFRIKF